MSARGEIIQALIDAGFYDDEINETIAEFKDEILKAPREYQEGAEAEILRLRTDNAHLRAQIDRALKALDDERNAFALMEIARDDLLMRVHKLENPDSDGWGVDEHPRRGW